MATATWWTHEARHCGRQAFVLPVLAALLAATAAFAHSGAGTLLARTLLVCALPVATALACASVTAREPMPELHLSLPTPYPRTVLRRLCWPASIAVLGATALSLLPGAARFGGPVLLLPELAGLTTLLCGLAVWATARAGSATPAAGLVLSAVLVKVLLLDQLAPRGLATALPEFLAGALLLALSRSHLSRLRHPAGGAA
ncbi:hypothetical protein ACQYWQ_12185 [Streptomyces sp. P6-2-1]|uniref:hypothetical protein n=1 Tax=unclassified Streptomyces TaxID=2593676 RepID=UPI003D3639F8